MTTDFIQGERFIKLAKWTYSPDVKSGDDYDKLPNTLNWSLLKDNDIVYTHTCYAKSFFDEIKRKNISTCFYLITHNSDVNVDESFEIPVNIVKWYSQNVAMKHPKLISIPIGLENNRWQIKFGKVGKYINIIQKPINEKQHNIAYLNVNISTNIQERLRLYTLFQLKPWVTCVRGKNGKNFDGYLDDLNNHSFVFCPNGNGIDTHRVWESLYIGAIPIMKKDINNQFYSDFGICFVDDWDEVTQPFLLSEINTNIQKQIMSDEKLTFSYWAHKIVNHE